MWSLTDAVVHDPTWSTDLQYHELLETANDDGRAHPTFAAARTIRGIIRPKSVLEFMVSTEGQLDDVELALVVDEAYNVNNDDRIVFRGVAYRTSMRETDYVDGFSIFALTEDGRTQTSDSSLEGDEEAYERAGNEFTRDYEVL